MTRFLAALIGSLFMVTACNAQDSGDAKPAAQYQPGVHYTVLDTPLRTNDKKIEVVEVFWYHCGHCYMFEPKIVEWKKHLPEDVLFRPSPVVWNSTTSTHARIFFVAKALGKLDEMHEAIFDAMNKDRKMLTSEKEIAEFFAKYGVDKEKFKETFDSYGVKTQVTQAGSFARGANITGTPEIVVAGKYRVSGDPDNDKKNILDHDAMLKVVDFLVEKERKARSSAS